VIRAESLRPSQLLDLLNAADALRRPERLDALFAAVACAVSPAHGSGEASSALRYVRAALQVAKSVDAAQVARGAARAPAPSPGTDPIASAVRSARLDALRAWKRSGALRSSSPAARSVP